MCKCTVKGGWRTHRGRAVQFAHFAEELWVKVTFAFARKAQLAETAARRIGPIVGRLVLMMDWQEW